MTESSKLMPVSIRNQSNAAITALQADNDSLAASKTALDAFINDNNNRSNRFYNLKRKMEDYKIVADAFKGANDADIADHRILIDIVGDQIFCGETIYRQIRSYENELRAIENNIEKFMQDRREVTSFQKLNPFNWTYSNALTNQRNWERTRDITLELIRELHKKIEQYNEIEQSTKHFFGIGRDLRATAKRGLTYIEEAASGLPRSYTTASLNRWRSGITSLKSNLEFNRLVIRSADGSISEYDWNAIGELLGRPAEEISTMQFAALAKILMVMTDEKQLQKFLQLLTSPVQLGYYRNDLTLLREFNHDIIIRIEAHLLVNILDNILSNGDSAQRYHAKQMITILGFMAATPQPFAGEDFPSQLDKFLELKGHGNGGYMLSIKQFGNIPWGPSHNVIWLEDNSQWKFRDIVFSEVLYAGPGEVSFRLRDIIGSEASNQYDEKINNVFLNALFAYSADVLNSVIRSNKFTGVAMEAVDQYKYIDNFINAIIDGYTKEQLESLERLGEIESILKNWEASDFARSFSLSGVVVSELGSLKPQFSCFPTKDCTKSEIDTFIIALNKSSINLAEFTADFNEKTGGNYYINPSADIGDLYANFPLFMALEFELLKRGER
jgi:hypothetical protein